jgi:transcriptional regulator with XRE-family HTH domain
VAQRREVEQTPEQPPILVVLGANVYRRRVLRVPKMSQDTLGELGDVAVSTIQAIESGRDPAKPTPPYPQLDTIEKLARALGCGVDDLLRWDRGTPS